MEKISVVIITFNEEDSIARCLESIKSIADEIVVVDSFSKDNTKSICLEYGVQFYEHAFEGYIQQKNYANSLAKFDYVLSLDADESLCPKLQKSILDEKAKGLNYDSYYMNRMTNYLGKWIRHGAWYPDRKLRLWNRHKGKWGGLNPHDKFEMKEGCTYSKLKGDILHYSYTSIEGHIAQFDKFTTISAIQMHWEGKKSSYMNILFSPLINFLKGFFLKLGFLDGYYGILICLINSFATFMKYVKLRELNRNRHLFDKKTKATVS